MREKDYYPFKNKKTKAHLLAQKHTVQMQTKLKIVRAPPVPILLSTIVCQFQNPNTLNLSFCKVCQSFNLRRDKVMIGKNNFL